MQQLTQLRLRDRSPTLATRRRFHGRPWKLGDPLGTPHHLLFCSGSSEGLPPRADVPAGQGTLASRFGWKCLEDVAAPADAG